MSRTQQKQVAKKRKADEQLISPKTRAQHRPENIIGSVYQVLRSVDEVGQIVQFSPIDSGDKSDAINRAVGAFAEIATELVKDIEYLITESSLDCELAQRLKTSGQKAKIVESFSEHLLSLVEGMVQRHRHVLSHRTDRAARQRVLAAVSAAESAVQKAVAAAESARACSSSSSSSLCALPQSTRQYCHDDIDSD